MSVNVPSNNVFISYARENFKSAERLYNDLKNAGLNPWLDKKNLRPGQNWKLAIKKAIKDSRFVILLISSELEKRRFVQREFKYALDILDEFLETDIFIIPVRLDECEIPYEKLEDIHYVDLFPDWDDGLNQILDTFKEKGIEIVEQESFTNKKISSNIDTFEFSIEEGNIETFKSDLLCLKYAQDFYGADCEISNILSKKEEISLDSMRSLPNKYSIVETNGSIKSKFVLFLGLPKNFRYKEIREFGAQVIKIISNEIPEAKYIAMTLHGPGAGLDEIESFFALFAGLLDGILTKSIRNSIKRITIVDRNHGRIQRIHSALEKKANSSKYVYKAEEQEDLYLISKNPKKLYGSKRDTYWNSAGKDSESKPHIFVAMPCSDEMMDVFYFGIQDPIHDANLLCERLGNDTFIEDEVEQIKKRIETSSLVIADLTEVNSNIYFVVGYAWGRERPTILVGRPNEDLRQNGVLGNKYFKYKTIKDLQNILSNEIKQLRFKRVI